MTKEYFENNSKFIGKKLKEFRKIMSLTQQDVAEDMMITKQGVNYIENYGCKAYYYLIAFCYLYKVDLKAFEDDKVYVNELVKAVYRTRK